MTPASESLGFNSFKEDVLRVSEEKTRGNIRELSKVFIDYGLCDEDFIKRLSEDQVRKGQKVFSPHYPYSDLIKKNTYQQQMHALKKEVHKLADFLKNDKRKVIVLLEERGFAGSDFLSREISRLFNLEERHKLNAEPLNQVDGDWFFKSFLEQLPKKGQLTVMPASWYKRLSVQSVLEQCDLDQQLEFDEQIEEVEEHLVEEGHTLLKFWLSISPEEQLRRAYVAIKQGQKLSEFELASLYYFISFTEAKEKMFFETDFSFAPWTIVRCDDSLRASLNLVKFLCQSFDYPQKDHELVKYDSQLIGEPGDLNIRPLVGGANLSLVVSS